VVVEVVVLELIILMEVAVVPVVIKQEQLQ
jgi:hypothetical protein